MKPADVVRHQFAESIATHQAAMEAIASAIAAAADVLERALAAGNKVLSCGNGGSAADAQHFSSELVNRFQAERPGLAAIALTTDCSTLTSVANDMGYPQVFARQIDALGRPGDVLLAITTSGNSENILGGIAAARARKLRVLLLTGGDGGRAAAMMSNGDVLMCVPGPSTARIQEVHILVIHCLCDLLDNHFSVQEMTDP